MKKILLIILLLFCLVQVDAQQPAARKQKMYMVWIRQSPDAAYFKGILWQINDSSILVANSIQSSALTEYDFNKIEILKIRKNMSIARGALWGFGLGFPSGIILINSVPGGLGFLTVPVSALAGLYAGGLAAGAGALAGAVRDRIPVGYSYDNFEKYRSSLLDYSFVSEQTTARHRFEHRGFAGATVGVSLASGEFISEVPVEDYHGMEMTGFGMTVFGGYRFTKNTAISLSMTNNMYAVKNSDNMLNWSLDLFLIKPVITLPLSAKFRLDLEPGLGYASAYFTDGEEFLLNGGGFGYQLNTSLEYNYSKRWFAKAVFGYSSSKQEYREGGNGDAGAVNIEIGLAYKFGKNSL